MRYFADHEKELDEYSCRRLKTNPLRILIVKSNDVGNVTECTTQLCAGG